MASNSLLCEALSHLSGNLSLAGAGEFRHSLLDVLPSVLSRLYHCSEGSCPSLALFPMDTSRSPRDGVFVLADLGDETWSLLVGRAMSTWARTIETREMEVVASASSVEELMKRVLSVESMRRTER